MAAAEKLCRHKVITLLRDEGLLSEERIALLLSWRHRGFSAHNAVTVSPSDRGGVERLARYPCGSSPSCSTRRSCARSSTPSPHLAIEGNGDLEATLP